MARVSRFVRLIAPLVAAAGLSACASISEKIASSMSEMPAIGLPADAPARPTEPAVYPAVHDMPPPRTAAVLTDLEQQKVEDDLMAARNRQQGAAGTALPERKQAPPSTPRLIPTASSRTIY